MTASWPRFTPEHQVLLQLKRNNVTEIADGQWNVVEAVNYRTDSHDAAPPSDFRVDMTSFENLPELLNEWEK